jgi:hypothetical protein
MKLFKGVKVYADKHMGIGLIVGDFFKKVFEVQLMPVKINRYWFMVNLSWTRRMDHAGPSFSFELPFMSFQAHLYDTRHWCYDKNRWYNDGEEQFDEGDIL